ncbi:MAG: hypothetical protein IT237_04880 [Bacteroidia bacterium]|nr:hypothetical protein [Bacteroidia bacterium]
MKKLAIALSIFIVLLFSSCKKDYVCVCTERATGEKNYGDHFKAGPYSKKVYEKSCEANDDVFEDGLENCHLE